MFIQYPMCFIYQPEKFYQNSNNRIRMGMYSDSGSAMYAYTDITFIVSVKLI